MSVSSEPMFAGLLDACHVMSLEQLPGEVRRHAARAGLRNVLIYLSDLQEDILRLLADDSLDAGPDTERQKTELAIDGTIAGESFQTLRPLREAGRERGRWWVPLLDSAERVGVMRMDTDATGEPDRSLMRQLATLVTMLVILKRAHSDSYARQVRTQPMTVAAEMQWNLMPPRAFAHDRVTICAALEPAYEVGGDAFDYALAGDVVHLGIFDAMGHDVAAGLTANLAVAACRNSRRQGADLIETGEAIERTLIQQLGPTRYVTALLANLNIRTGQLDWISHGHHSPVVVRDNRWTGLLPCPPGAPLGADLGLKAALCRDHLDPGDRLVLYTDGVTETHSPGGEEFGLDRFMNFIIRHNAEGLPVPETLRRLVHSVLEYHEGRIQDDATVLFLEWHGPDAHANGAASPAELISHND